MSEAWHVYHSRWRTRCESSSCWAWKLWLWQTQRGDSMAATKLETSCSLRITSTCRALQGRTRCVGTMMTGTAQTPRQGCESETCAPETFMSSRLLLCPIHLMSPQVWRAFPLHVGCVWSWPEGSGQANSRGAGLRQLPAGRGLLHAGWTDIWDHCRVQSPADAGRWRCGLVQLPRAHLKGYWCIYDTRCTAQFVCLFVCLFTDNALWTDTNSIEFLL